MPHFVETVPLPRLDCDIATALRKEVRGLFTRSVGKDFFGAPALIVGQNTSLDAPETFRALNAVDALAHMAGYIQVWANKQFPCNVHPAVRAVYEKCRDCVPDDGLFMLLMAYIEGAVVLYMPDEELELRVRIYIPEERLPDAVAEIERFKPFFYQEDSIPVTDK